MPAGVAGRGRNTALYGFVAWIAVVRAPRPTERAAMPVTSDFFPRFWPSSIVSVLPLPTTHPCLLGPTRLQHICFTIFLLWAYTPERVLVSFGMSYYPAKHWAIALPCWTLVSLLAVVLLYGFYNVMRQPDLESLSNIVDEYTRVPDERDLSGWADEERLPTGVDLPITLVSRILHLVPPAGPPAGGAAGGPMRPPEESAHAPAASHGARGRSEAASCRVEGGPGLSYRRGTQNAAATADAAAAGVAGQHEGRHESSRERQI